MKLIPDHPVISSLRRNGVPEPDEDNTCPNCGYNYDCGTLFGKEVPLFKVNGDWICFECFEQWALDLIRTNPDMVAGGLGIDFATL